MEDTMQAKVQYVSFPADCRVIAISDIHGNLDYFQGLLRRINYTCQDILVLVGDMLEKGKQNLELVRCLKELSSKGTVYMLTGNNDIVYEDIYEDMGPDGRGGMLNYMLRKDRQGGLLHQMAAEINWPVTPDMNIDAFCEALLAHFPEELNFLRGLPDIIESDKIRFVHAGLTSNILSEQTSSRCRKNDNFMEQGIAMDKFCVVGHWPVCNYLRKTSPPSSFLPYFDPELNICSIDGGCNMKSNGQLNALILPGGDPSKMSFASYDSFPIVTALDAQTASSNPRVLVWGAGRHWITLLEEKEDFCLVSQDLTGELFWAPKKRIYTGSDGRLSCAEATTWEPEISPGEEVSLIQETSRGYYIRKNGTCGWYHGRIQR